MTKASTYLARVVLTNFGQRTTWVMASVADMTLENECSADGEPEQKAATVVVQPERFVLSPSGSQARFFWSLMVGFNRISWLQNPT